jgi:hypothetical protein
MFDWDDGAKRGLIEAYCEGEGLVGRYLNLDAPEITRPWVGLIVDATRIDGEIPGGRIDFRRFGTRHKRAVSGLLTNSRVGVKGSPPPVKESSRRLVQAGVGMEWSFNARGYLCFV